MQNPSIAYVLTDENRLFVFYSKQNNLLYYEYEIDKPQTIQLLESSISGFFSVSYFLDTIYVLYYKEDKNLYVATTKDGSSWKHTLCFSQVENFQKSKPFLLPTEETCFLISHAPTKSNPSQSMQSTQSSEALFYHAYDQGIWQNPIFIDQFTPNPQTPFFSKRISQNHIILYYRTSKTTWSAREILLEPLKIGSLVPLFQTNAPCIDLSIINTNEKIHMLYIIRTMFRTQVIYQYKQTNRISPPKILWEGNNCQNCLLTLEYGILTVFWQVNHTLMYCTSVDEGVSFDSAKRFSDAYPQKLQKASFIPSSHCELNASELFVDLNQNHIPFLPSQRLKEYLKTKPIQSKAPTNPTKQSAPPINPNPKPSNINPQNIQSYKSQINELNQILSQKHQEIAILNNSYQQKVSALETELLLLKSTSTKEQNEPKSKEKKEEPS